MLNSLVKRTSEYTTMLPLQHSVWVTWWRVSWIPRKEMNIICSCGTWYCQTADGLGFLLTSYLANCACQSIHKFVHYLHLSICHKSVNKQVLNTQSARNARFVMTTWRVTDWWSRSAWGQEDWSWWSEKCRNNWNLVQGCHSKPRMAWREQVQFLKMVCGSRQQSE